MNYGAGSEQASGTDERNQNNKEHWDAYHTQQGEEGGTKYVEGMDINSEEYYNWYYKNYYAQNHPQDQPPQGEQQGNDECQEEGEGKEEGGKKGKKRKVSKFLAQKPVEGTHVLNFIVEIALLFKPLVSVSYCHINFKFYYGIVTVVFFLNKFKYTSKLIKIYANRLCREKFIHVCIKIPFFLHEGKKIPGIFKIGILV